jgi:hypothetical protein
VLLARGDQHQLLLLLLLHPPVLQVNTMHQGANANSKVEPVMTRKHACMGTVLLLLLLLLLLVEGQLIDSLYPWQTASN